MERLQDPGRVEQLLAAGSPFWLDTDDVEPVAATLGLHPAAVEDTSEWGQLPRLDDYGDHALLIFFTARLPGEAIEVHVYVAANWIVTVRRCETLLDSRREHIDDLYGILDALLDGWDPVIEDLDERVDVIEEAVLDRPRQDQLRTIYRLRQEIHELLRRAAPQHANVERSLQTIVGDTRGWMQDVQAHASAIESDLRRISGDLQALTDTFFNANANRLNQLATRVAIGSLFFLIWTFVTGFFGQNFGYLTDHIDSKGAFFAYELGALVIPTLLLAAFLWWRRRDWL